jgi:hypothetical protein
MKEYRNRFYIKIQKDAKTKDDLGKDRMTMLSQNRFDCQHHEMKNKNRET